MRSTRWARSRSWLLVAGAALVLGACEGGGDMVGEGATQPPEPSIETSADPDQADGPVNEAGEAGSGAPSSHEGADGPDEATLLAALDRYGELRAADPEGSDAYCTRLSGWPGLREASASAGGDDRIEHGGLTRQGQHLLAFGCGTARQDGGLFGVLVSVERTPLDLPDDLAPATTPAGHDVLMGFAEIGDLSLFTDAAVPTVLATAGDTTLHVTSLPDVLEPQQLLTVFDAAWTDLRDVS